MGRSLPLFVHSLGMFLIEYTLLLCAERRKTQCEHHRDQLQDGAALGAFIPQCDEQGHYRPLQCHGSTGHCWCVDGRGQERAGTRTPSGTPPANCDTPGKHILLLYALYIQSMTACHTLNELCV